MMHVSAASLHAQCGTIISTFPYQEDFETSNGGWTSGGVSNDWAWGAPVKPVINSAGSGAKCWITGGLSVPFYNYSERSYVQSPCFDFSTLANVYIEFKVFWETEHQYDGANLQYSTNSGVSWNNVGALGDATDCMNANWYNYSPIYNLTSLAAVRDGWSGTVQPTSGSCQGGSGSGGWLEAKHTMPYLAGLTNVIFRFTFGAGTTCNNYDGFAFDDIIIGNAPLPLTVSHALTPAGCISSNGSATLSVNGSFPPYTYIWTPNVSSTATANGLSSGNYTITVTDMAGCSKTEIITILQSPPVTFTNTSSPDTCKRNVGTASVAVNTGTPPYTYLWNPAGETTSTLNNLSEGNYSIVVTDSQGCTKAASVFIDNTGEFTIELGNDTTICSNNSFMLSPGNFASYTWQDNSQNSFYEIAVPGIYWVEVISSSGCSASDTINIIEDCLHDIIVPNAFSPNGDGINDVFLAQAVHVEVFNMQVYNRWGERVFESNSIQQGWKGSHKKSKAGAGIYTWMIQYSVDGIDMKRKAGTVFLLR